MRKYWWTSGLLFVACAVVYTVGTGWPARMSVSSNIAHAKRQVEPAQVLKDLRQARGALRTHRRYVSMLSFIFKKPNLWSSYRVEQQLINAHEYFKSLGTTGRGDVADGDAFDAGLRQLQRAQVPSISVIPQRAEMWLQIGMAVFAGITILLGSVRVISGAQE